MRNMYVTKADNLWLEKNIPTLNETSIRVVKFQNPEAGPESFLFLDTTKIK